MTSSEAGQHRLSRGAYDGMMLGVSTKMEVHSRAARQRVLLIDDDESIAGSLFQYLLTQGCDVDVAVDSACAARQMAGRRYDVVLVDPYLTGGVLQDDGALLAMIREQQPSAALIVLTGYGSSTLKRSAERERASAVLTKPQPVVLLSQLVVASGIAEGTHP